MQTKTLLCALCLFFSTFVVAQNIPYRNLFNDNLIPRIDIVMPEDSVTWLYNNVNYDGNLRANFVFSDGVKSDTMRNVGFRLRGNTSRSSAKKSFKIKFNAYTSGIKYQGVKELNLNGQHNDPTMVREKLFYEVWNAAGLPPRRASFSKLYINNRYYGLYTSIEEMDDEWLKKAYGKDNDTGNLYKCTYPADLKYINDMQANYKAVRANTTTAGRAYDLKTNELADDYSDLVTLIKKGNQSTTANIATELSSILDIDKMLKAYAVELMLGHWDDYAYNKNNYFLYHNPESKLFEFISYDADNTFGVDWVGKDWGLRAVYTWHTPANGILIDNILKVPFYKNIFSNHLKNLMGNILTPSSMNTRIDSLHEQVRAAATEDTYRTKDYGFTMAQFNDNFNYTAVKQAKYGLKGFIQTIRTTVNNQLIATSTEAAPAPTSTNTEAAKVFPNPSTTQFSVDLGKVNVKDTQIQLLNMQGEVIKDIVPQNDKTVVNTEGLPKGIYFVKTKVANKVSFRKILINN